MTQENQEGNVNDAIIPIYIDVMIAIVINPIIFVNQFVIIVYVIKLMVALMAVAI